MTIESCRRNITDERLMNLRQLQAEAKRFVDGRQMLLFSERDLESISVEDSAAVPKFQTTRRHNQ